MRNRAVVLGAAVACFVVAAAAPRMAQGFAALGLVFLVIFIVSAASAPLE